MDDVHQKTPEHVPSAGDEFAAGSKVVYGLHGPCEILSIENRSVSGEDQRYYKVEIEKSALSRSKKAGPAIWVPVAQAPGLGLRARMSLDEANAAVATLQSREYFFPLNEAWSSVYPKLESCLKSEGAVGLAKVYSYVYTLKQKQVVPAPEVAKFFETLHRQLYRELSEALHEAPRSIEQRISKGLRSKLTADQ